VPTADIPDALGRGYDGGRVSSVQYATLPRFGTQKRSACRTAGGAVGFLCLLTVRGSLCLQFIPCKHILAKQVASMEIFYDC
jgi:hypothetical protein